MSLVKMHAALTEAREYLVDQDLDERTEESFKDITYTFAIRSAKHAIEGAARLVTEHGATVVLGWELGEGSIELESTPSGDRWQASPEALSTVLAALHGRNKRPEWGVDVLGPAFPELDKASSSHGRLTLSKRSWRTDLENDLDRAVWMGPSMAGFERWVLEQRSWRELANVLLARTGVTIVVEDGPPAADDAGPRVTVVSPGGKLTRAEEEIKGDTALQERLQLQRLGGEVRLWRAASLRPEAPLPPRVRARLWGVATSAAAWVLAQDRTDPHRVRPRRDKARTYVLADPPPDLDDRRGAAIRELASWVTRDLTGARIAVAQRVAAAEIADCRDATPAAAIKQTADIAYDVVIDRTVQEALDRQAVFEQTFADLDKSVAGIRSDISNSVDQVVTRTLTGASAFTIAALASARFRGAAALVAAGVIAVFVAANLVLLLRSTRPEALERLHDVDHQVARRRAGLSGELAEELTGRLVTWKSDIERRIRAGALVLALLIVALLGVGLGVALATNYESGAPRRSCTCHAAGPGTGCTCSTP